MSFNELSNLPEAKQGIERYAGNDNLFRFGCTFEEFASLPRYKFHDFHSEESYKHHLQELHLPSVVFIDLSDIAKFLKIENKPGFDAIDISQIAQIVCDFLGEDSNLCDVLWNNFDEEISSEIMARLGLDYDNSIMGQPFNDAIGTVYEISKVIHHYLINARYPLIELESVYKLGGYQNGLLGLRLKTYTEFNENYG